MTNDQARQEMPLGLEMKFGAYPEAMTTFSQMSVSEQNAAIHYIKNAVTGPDAMNRINEVINKLNHHNIRFFS